MAVDILGITRKFKKHNCTFVMLGTYSHPSNIDGFLNIINFSMSPLTCVDASVVCCGRDVPSVDI